MRGKARARSYLKKSNGAGQPVQGVRNIQAGHLRTHAGQQLSRQEADLVAPGTLRRRCGRRSFGGSLYILGSGRTLQPIRVLPARGSGLAIHPGAARADIR